VELALIDVLEQRVQDGKGSWRRGGTSITGRELAAWHGSVILKSPRDYRRFVPMGANTDFTVRSLAEQAKISPEIAQKTLYVLTKMGVVERIGKVGRLYNYRIKKGQ
jgi:predicted HTH transcriptional regulator